MPKLIRWTVPTELTADEAQVTKAPHRIGKFYVFLREIRAELFDDAHQPAVGVVVSATGASFTPVTCPPLV